MHTQLIKMQVKIKQNKELVNGDQVSDVLGAGPVKKVIASSPQLGGGAIAVADMQSPRPLRNYV